MESLRREFFWGGNEKKKAIPWVKWEVVCSKLDKGGLDIGSLDNANVALLSKWVWRFKNESEAIWVKIIKSIHGKNGLIDNNSLSKAKSSAWKNIVQAAGDVPESISVCNTLKAKVGDGANTFFWRDSWLNDQSLREEFPRLYELGVDKLVTVADWFKRMKGVHWSRDNLGPGRIASDRLCLQNQVNSTLLSTKKDIFQLSNTTNGVFSVSFFRNLLDEHYQQLDGPATTWNKWIPRKTNILMWRLRRRRIPTRDVLTKMGIAVPDHLCQFCGSAPETIDHVFFSCAFAAKIWENFRDWWNFSTFNAISMETLEDWCATLILKGRRLKCLKVSIAAVCHVIWEVRNGYIFRGEKTKTESAIRSYKEKTLFWLSCRSSKVECNSVGWYSCPNFRLL